jgi:hypothetical protein
MRYVVVFFFVIGFIIVQSCGDSQHKEAEKKAATDVSELALLMRQMVVDAQLLRDSLEAGNSIPDFREKFRAIHKAIPTEPLGDKPAFDAMADIYLNQLDSLYLVQEPERRVQVFNSMINNCVVCHEQYCPGPIKRIKKLNI